MTLYNEYPVLIIDINTFLGLIIIAELIIIVLVTHSKGLI